MCAGLRGISWRFFIILMGLYFFRFCLEEFERNGGVALCIGEGSFDFGGGVFFVGIINFF